VDTECQQNSGGDGNPLRGAEERCRIGDRQGLGRGPRAKNDPTGGRSDNGLNPIIYRVDYGNLVSDNFDYQQDTKDPEHPVIAEPAPSRRKRDEREEFPGKPERKQWHIGVQPGRNGETSSREDFEHRISLRWAELALPYVYHRNAMFVIGLTGGIASGKSVVARRLTQHGAIHVDADALAREVVEPGTPALAKIVEHFGRSILDADGALDRPALGSIVFENEHERLVLNSITHPAVWRRARELFAEAEAADSNAVIVYDVPLLVEASSNRPLKFDLVVVVHADEAVRHSRLVNLRHMRSEDATSRIRSQASDSERLAVADVVIDSNGTLSNTFEQVDALWSRVKS